LVHQWLKQKQPQQYRSLGLRTFKRTPGNVATRTPGVEQGCMTTSSAALFKMGEATRGEARLFII